MSKQQLRRLILLFISISSLQLQSYAQGTWVPLTNGSVDPCGGVMLLLSDGTVITKSFSGGTDGFGNVWDKLTPDSTGSYVNGTWTTIAPMYDTRLYFSSQVLKDGRVYVAGGEYGSGGPKGEIYDPLTDVWTQLPSPTPSIGDTLDDACSAMLPDGRILQACVNIQDTTSDSTTIYNPLTNSYSLGPVTHGNFDESSWVKLPDNSILFVDLFSTNSERYIPSLNQWIVDATLPVELYGQYDYEVGPGFLLPDGRAFFVGSTGSTAYYTPSGNTSNGTWAVGPQVPDSLGAIDAPGAMMVNGKILYTFSPVFTSYTDTYLPPTYYYEFDYSTNIFTPIVGPYGDSTQEESCFETNMLDLPDGTVLYSDFDSYQYFIYVPDGTPLAAGKPAISNVLQNQCTYTVTGTLFNGLGEGAAYGDDWQMSTNYPLVRLSNATNAYYARTFNWNRTGVQTGSLPDTTQFTLPAGLPNGTYSLVVTANGISSDPYTFVYTSCETGMQQLTSNTQIRVSPNPASATIEVNSQTLLTEIIIADMLGREVSTNSLENKTAQVDVSNLPNGVYFITAKTSNSSSIQKIVVQH